MHHLKKGGAIIGVCLAIGFGIFLWSYAKQSHHDATPPRRTFAPASNEENTASCGIITLTDSYTDHIFTLDPSRNENVIFGRITPEVGVVMIKVNGTGERPLYLPVDPEDNDPRNNIDGRTTTISVIRFPHSTVKTRIAFYRFNGPKPPDGWLDLVKLAYK